jgi:hypothetical protein
MALMAELVRLCDEESLASSYGKAQSYFHDGLKLLETRAPTCANERPPNLQKWSRASKIWAIEVMAPSEAITADGSVTCYEH